jgi:hypothetical protein
MLEAALLREDPLILSLQSRKCSTMPVKAKEETAVMGYVVPQEGVNSRGTK